MQLFEWAQNGHDRTVNLRARLGLIIVINKDVTSLDEKWLDVKYATKTLLKYLELSTAGPDDDAYDCIAISEALPWSTDSIRGGST